MQAVDIGDIFRTDILAASAAHAHMIAKAVFIVVDLVQHFEAHPLSLVLAETDAAGDI